MAAGFSLALSLPLSLCHKTSENRSTKKIHSLAGATDLRIRIAKRKRCPPLFLACGFVGGPELNGERRNYHWYKPRVRYNLYGENVPPGSKQV